MTSYRVFEKLQKVLPDRELPDHGIRMRMANFFFDKPIEETEDEYEKMLEIESIPEVRITILGFSLSAPNAAHRSEASSVMPT